MNNDLKKERIYPVVIGILSALIIILVVTIVVILCTGSGNENNQQGESLADFDSSVIIRATVPTDPVDAGQNSEPVDVNPMENEPVKIPEGNYQVTMTTEWNYPDIGTPAEDSYVENAVENPYDTRFSVVLASDESVKLYESPRLPVGSFTTGIPIKTELAPGSYDCIMIYTLYAPGTDTNCGTVRVGLKINIG